MTPQKEPQAGLPGAHPQKIILELIRYDRENYVRYDDLNADDLCAQVQPNKVNWINVDGLNDDTILQRLQAHFNLHTLLIDDVLSDQRPKTEEYDDYLFFTMKMLHRIEGSHIDYEQVSFVLGKDFLLSFQDKEGDFFEGFRERIRKDLGKVRKMKADYLLYRLIDIIIDNYYNALDTFGDTIEEIEEEIHLNPNDRNFDRIQRLRKELIFLRRAVYPLRDALNKLVKGESNFIEDATYRYFSDVYDHVVHLSDSMEMYNDLTSSLLDIHINTLNTRMNEVMKVLTVLSTIFMPLTFIVGVYGMNFKYLPELNWRYGYVGVWGLMIAIVIGMLIFFKHKKWF
jgi:magnesium transporter